MSAGSKNKLMKKQWSHLPRELWSQIAGRLGLIDFLRFRAVCKDFLLASACSSVAIVETEPWFLVYGESPKCSLMTYDKLGTVCINSYTLDFPELYDAMCLASCHGWLLMFQRGFVFFFHPFTHAMIHLPDFPLLHLTSLYAGAFSCPPSSTSFREDCVVTVITRTNIAYLELNVLYGLNNSKWTTYEIKYCMNHLETFYGATYYGGRFYFMDFRFNGITFCPKQLLLRTFTKLYNYEPYVDDVHKGMVFSPEQHLVQNCRLQPPSRDKKSQGRGTQLPFRTRWHHTDTMKVRRPGQDGYKDVYIPVPSCGTLTIQEEDTHTLLLIPSEKIFSHRRFEYLEVSKWVRGVWIQPTFPAG